jgi:hypothetical protein
MASVNKIQLSTSTLLKPSSADVVSEVIVLPHYAEEVLLVSETGVSLSSGTVLKCKLEHSPNGIDWVDVKVEEITSSSGGSNFGNEWYVNTLPGVGEDKNKHIQLYSGFTSGGSSDDVISSQMEVAEPFTTSMWLKSTEVPATAPAVIENLKGLQYPAGGQFFTGAVTTTNRNGPFGSMGTNATMRGTPDSDDAWSFAGWIYFPVNANSPNVGFLKIVEASVNTVGGGLLLTSKFASATSIQLEASVYGNGGVAKCAGTGTIADITSTGGWYHLVITKALQATDETGFTMYINNTPLTTVDTTAGGNTISTFISPNTPSISGVKTVGTYWADKAIIIDDWSFWDKQIDPDEVTDLYTNKPNLRGTDHVVGYYRMGDGDSVGDGSGTMDSVVGGQYPVLHDMSDHAGGGTVIGTNLGYYSGSGGSIGTLSATDPTYRLGASATTTYSPILFRCGGKTEPFAINKAISVEYSNTNGTLELRNISGNVIHEEKDWTIYTWYKYDSSGGSVDILAGLGTSGSTNRIQFRYYKVHNGTDTFSTSLGGSYEVNFTLPHTLDDGEWHQLAWVFKGVGAGNSGAAWKHHTATTISTDAGMKVYVDGTQAFATSETPKILTLQPTAFGTGGILGYNSSAFFDMAELGVFDSALTTSEIESLYNGTPGTAGGSPSGQLSSISSCVFYADIEAETIGAISSGDIVDNQISGNSYDLYSTGTLGNNFVASSGNVAVDITGYFGDGITLSITDKVKTSDGTWSAAGNEDPHLLLSFDGFENDADQWVAWKCTQDIDNNAATPDVNFLDGAWHNLVISYRGVTVSNAGSLGTLRGLFSKSVTGDDLDNSHLILTIDGKPLYHINSNKSVDAAKVKDGAGFAYLDMLPQHLRNVSDTYVRTTFLGSGLYTELYGATGDSPYAYQGDCDEISFHKDTFWKDPSTPGIVCGCPLEVLYGNNSERTTAEPGIPHDLMDPSTVQTDPVTTLTAYLEPYPTGQFRCNENIATHTTETICNNGHAAHTTPLGTVGSPANWVVSTGGLELWYRWGDTPADCAICVKDVRETETTGATTRGGEIKGDLSTADLTKMTGAAGETVYKAGGGGGGTQKDHVIFTHDALASGPHLVTHLNLPHLHYLRAVYTGDGVNTDGSLISSLYYSRRKS